MALVGPPPWGYSVSDRTAPYGRTTPAGFRNPKPTRLIARTYCPSLVTEGNDPMMDDPSLAARTILDVTGAPKD